MGLFSRGRRRLCAPAQILSDVPARIEPLEARLLFTRFAVTGDLEGGSALRDVAALMKTWNPDQIISLGDNVHDEDIDDTVGKYFHEYLSPYKGDYGAGSTSGNRFWSALGNHDYDDIGVSRYTSFFTFPGNERYYSVKKDNVELFFVNSNSEESAGTSSASTQGQWLKNALAASSAQWKLVIFHYPAYTSGTEGDHENMQWPFQQWGATAVLSAHDHMYERILKNGFPYFVNGLGGATIIPPNSTESGSQVRYSSDYGAMLIETGATTINFKFINRSGSVKDNYTITKPVSPPPPPPVPGFTTLISKGANWRFFDSGTDLNVYWRARKYSPDATWKTGDAQLGYGDGDEKTVVSFGPDSDNKVVSTYFRKGFAITDPTAVQSLNVNLLRDDGAVVYLNGWEVYRNNMPTGTVDYKTLAATNIDDSTFFSAAISPSYLISGTNVIAVEVHQAAAASSDLSFDFELTGIVKQSPPPPPPIPVSDLPAPWWHQDVGNVGIKGSTTVSNGIFTVKGSGTDIWFNSDEMQFVHQTLTGDGSIVARVLSMGDTNEWAKAGVMMRDSLAPDAKNMAIHLTPTNGVGTTYRASAAGASDGTLVGSGATPHWLKIVRSGNLFSTYHSADGVAWKLVDSHNIAMGQTLFVGLCVSSKNNSLLNTATFDNVTVKTGS